MDNADMRTCAIWAGLVLAVVGASILWGGGAALLVGGVMLWKGSE